MGGRRWEIRLAGTGGQGQVLAAIILAEAAGIHDGYTVVQTQDYGPESRGGSSKAEVVITDEPDVDYPKVTAPNVLVAMSQDAFDRYAGQVAPGGVILADSTWVKRTGMPSPARVFALPVTDLARNEAGRALVANIVALGALSVLTDAVSYEAIERVVMARVPRGTEEINRRALEIGRRAAMAAISAGNGSVPVGDGSRDER